MTVKFRKQKEPMRFSIHQAAGWLLTALLINSCASQPVSNTGVKPVTIVQSQTQGNKKLYTTQDGLAVACEVVQGTVPVGFRSYKTGSGDVLDVLLEYPDGRAHPDYYVPETVERFAGMEYSRYQVTVDPMGNINLPLIGELHAADLSLSELEHALKKKLGAFLEKPQAAVRLVSNASYSISVLGEVNKPGRYEIKKPITLSEALALGGGVSHDGTLSRIYLGRRGQKSQRLNLTEVWANGALDNEILLERDDVVFVPPKLWITLTELEQVSTVIANISNVVFQWK